MGRRCRDRWTDGRTDRKTKRRLRVKSGTGHGSLLANSQVGAMPEYWIPISRFESRNLRLVVLSFKKLEALLRSLANCTFLWLLLVAQPPGGDATLSQKASSHLPHAHSQTPRSVARWPPPFALRGIRPSACLGMGLDANGTAHIRACLAKRFLKREGKIGDHPPKAMCSSRGHVGGGSAGARLTSGQRP